MAESQKKKKERKKDGGRTPMRGTAGFFSPKSIYAQSLQQTISWRFIYLHEGPFL